MLSLGKALLLAGFLILPAAAVAGPDAPGGGTAELVTPSDGKKNGPASLAGRTVEEVRRTLERCEAALQCR